MQVQAAILYNSSDKGIPMTPSTNDLTANATHKLLLFFETKEQFSSLIVITSFIFSSGYVRKLVLQLTSKWAWVKVGILLFIVM